MRRGAKRPCLGLLRHVTIDGRRAIFFRAFEAFELLHSPRMCRVINIDMRIALHTICVAFFFLSARRTNVISNSSTSVLIRKFGSRGYFAYLRFKFEIPRLRRKLPGYPGEIPCNSSIHSRRLVSEYIPSFCYIYANIKGYTQ